MKHVLRIIGLKVWVNGRLILNNVNAVFEPSTITAIMGPSGTGKTTLLKTINRLIELYPGSRVEGKILLGGENVYEMNPVIVRRRIGMVFQDPNPFPHLSIYDNIALAPRIHGLVRSKEETDELVRWALEKAMLWEEVRDRLGDLPSTLSGGQQQRLCLARTLALRPEILLLDEPTANVDPYNTRRIEEAIMGLARNEGVTVIMVTHTPEQARRVADRILVLSRENGRDGYRGAATIREENVVLRPRY